MTIFGVSLLLLSAGSFVAALLSWRIVRGSAAVSSPEFRKQLAETELDVEYTLKLASIGKSTKIHRSLQLYFLGVGTLTGVVGTVVLIWNIFVAP